MNNDSNLTELDFEKFTITSKREIAFILSSLVAHGEPMTMLFNNGAESFITILLDVDDEAGLVIFDWGGSEEINVRFLRGSGGTLLCHPRGIRVQCHLERVRKVTYGGRLAFVADLPSVMLRMQRREFFRLNLPMSQQPLCCLEPSSSTPLTLPIQGLSIDGLSFTEAPEAFARFDPLTRIPRCVFDLGEFGVVECGVEVRYIAQVASRTGGLIGRMGCHFFDIHSGTQAHIQRYMIHIECERRALELLE
jgi:c-di-GMP-binding flagellar brake protein YcgR